MFEWKKLLYVIGVFLGVFHLPLENARFTNAVFEALALARWYAREHVVLCLVPAFFIAGAVAVFVSKSSVMKYFGNQAKKYLSYGVASVSGTILAVCSCTVLPLFAGIYKRGAGIGPAIAFLYSGPAINVLAVILTARVLGWEIGLARAIGAVIFSIVIGISMHLIFPPEERSSEADDDIDEQDGTRSRSLAENMLYFGSMVAFLVFANWGRPLDAEAGLWTHIYRYRWIFAGISLLGLFVMLKMWFSRSELKEWTKASWKFALDILPLLLIGVLISGFFLGRVGQEGMIPSRFVETLVGGNSLRANFFSSIAGGFMYFATLTEVPILQGLIGSGMGSGPALALLLAGPALSLPSMLVIKSVIGLKRTAVYISLVVVMATISGMIFGAIMG